MTWSQIGGGAARVAHRPGTCGGTLADAPGTIAVVDPRTAAVPNNNTSTVMPRCGTTKTPDARPPTTALRAPLPPHGRTPATAVRDCPATFEVPPVPRPGGSRAGPRAVTSGSGS